VANIRKGKSLLGTAKSEQGGDWEVWGATACQLGKGRKNPVQYRGQKQKKKNFGGATFSWGGLPGRKGGGV